MEKILSAEQSAISSQDLLKSNYYGYVYLTTNLLNNKKYVGVHKAKEFDPMYKGSGKILWKAIEKHGWDNFKVEILKWCFSKEDLFESERIEIENRNAVLSEEYYNIMPGGYGGDNKSYLTEEEYASYIEKIRQSKINRPLTEKESEHLEKMHKIWKGQHHTEESKQKSRESNLGQKRSDSTRKHLSENHADVSGKNNPFYGKKHSEETRRKIKENSGVKGKIWVTNKVDQEILITPAEFNDYVSKGFVRGKLRKSQKEALKKDFKR